MISTTQAYIPRCGFLERADGEVVWGSHWEPGGYYPEPVVVEYEEPYEGIWVPRQAWVRGESGLDMYDCDWVPSAGCIYYDLAGGGQPYVNGYADTSGQPGRIWIANGHHVVDSAGERHPLTDAELLERGLKRIHGPPPAPFADAIEGRTSWCEVCEETISEDDTAPCCVCEEDVHIHIGSAVAIVDPKEGALDSRPGVYAVLRQPFMTSALVGGGWFHDDALARVGDIPAKVDTWGYAGAPICRSCAPEPEPGPPPMTAYELGLLRRLSSMPGDRLTFRMRARLVDLAARASVVDAAPELARLLEVVRDRATPEMDAPTWMHFRLLIRRTLEDHSASLRVRGTHASDE